MCRLNGYSHCIYDIIPSATLNTHTHTDIIHTIYIAIECEHRIQLLYLGTFTAISYYTTNTKHIDVYLNSGYGFHFERYI